MMAKELPQKSAFARQQLLDIPDDNPSYEFAPPSNKTTECNLDRNHQKEQVEPLIKVEALKETEK